MAHCDRTRAASSTEQFGSSLDMCHWTVWLKIEGTELTEGKGVMEKLRGLVDKKEDGEAHLRSRAWE